MASATAVRTQDDILTLVTEGSRKFVDSYYDAINNDREPLQDFYHEDASIVFNGNPIKGGKAFADFFAPLPFAGFDVQAFDAQPMPPDSNGSFRFLVTVSGNVKWGDKKLLKGFSDMFVLRTDQKMPDRFCVASQIFRIVV